MLDEIWRETDISTQKLVQRVGVDVRVWPDVPRTVLNLKVINYACEVRLFCVPELEHLCFVAKQLGLYLKIDPLW